MLTHYLTIAFRNLRKYGTQSLVGIFGLAFGLACFVPALYWLRYEMSYDRFYPDAAFIYRIYSVEKQSGKVNEKAPGILEKQLHEQFPAMETTVGFEIMAENYSAEATPHIRLRTLYADDAFFRVFQQTFISGDARQPLQTARHIVLTETVAIRLFGDAEKAIGQQVKSTLYFFPPYTVSAVVKDPPSDTNLSFDVIHFPEIQRQMIDYMPEESQWTYFNKQMYVKLHPRADVDELAGQLLDLTSRVETNANIELQMLPIVDVRHLLNQDLPFTLNFVRLFVAAGILLLFSAFFNFLNLRLDFFRQRLHELRLRTVNGAKGGQLMLQMMFEMVFYILPALALAGCIVVLVLPAFSGLLHIEIESAQLVYLFAFCGTCVMALLLFAALIPMLRLSHLAVHHLAKLKPAGKPLLRRMAVTMQLTVSVVFIIAASVVMMQMRFVNRKDLGFDRSAVIQLSGIPGTLGAKKQTALKNELAAIPQIENITTTDFEPTFETKGITEVEWSGKPLHEKPVFERIGADSHFAETFRLKLRMGAWWNEGEKHKIVLNEEAVRVMGLREPLGAVIRMYPDYVSSDGNTPMQEYEVAGVVSDFHTLSLRSRIYPAIFMEPSMGSGNILYIRTIPGQEQEAIQRITAVLPGIDATLDVRLTPLDELYNRLNHSEQAGLKIFSVLATVCLLISLFGIYAVATAFTQRRRKEVAIRKVVGAEVGDIIRLFFREYTQQVIFAGVIALPLAYYAMSRWLQGYAYRTDIPWWLLGGIVVTVIVLVLFTVLGQVLKAANQNPAEVVKGDTG